MINNDNPWTARFEPLMDRMRIARMVELKPIPIFGLRSMPIEHACQTLNDALKSVFIPTQQCLDILERWLNLAYSHSLRHYPDKVSFLRGVYQEDVPLPSLSNIMCLTGLAGVGKSELTKALMRILPESVLFDVNDHRNFQTCSAWNFAVNANASTNSILTKILGIEGQLTELISSARKKAYTDGVSLMISDELQFNSLSSDSNTRIAKLILSLGYIGIPYVYIGNFSLLHRLLRRNQEEKQRFLTDVTLLSPDHPESADWMNTLIAFQEAAPEVFDIDLKEHATRIHQLTAGIKRALVKLYMIAFKIAHVAKRKVTFKDLETAYNSHEYYIYRGDIEAIKYQIIKNEKYPSRDDLWCPISIPNPNVSHIRNIFVKQEEENQANKILLASLNAKERNGLKQLKVELSPEMKTRKKVANSRGSQKTAEILMDNAKWISENSLKK